MRWKYLKTVFIAVHVTFMLPKLLAIINNYNSHIYDLFKKFNTVSVVLTTFMECILVAS